MPDIILLPFFNTVKTASKNDKAKHGDMVLANKYINIALLDMDKWIDKGNWANGYGTAFIGFRDCMQRYYLRLTGQLVRQTQVYASCCCFLLLLVLHLFFVDNADVVDADY